MVIKRTVRLKAILKASKMSKNAGGIGMIITEIIPITDKAKRTSIYWESFSKNVFTINLQPGLR